MKQIRNRIYCIFLTLLFAGLLSGCGTKVAGMNNEEPKVPEPASAASGQWECGTYYSDISTEQIQAYLLQLKEDGWKDFYGNEIPVDIADGISEVILTRGETLLQIMLYLMDRDCSISNSILVRKDSNIDIAGISSRKAAVTREEAIVKIKQYVSQAHDSEEFPYALEQIVGVQEIFPEGAYDKLELQAFAAISDSGFYGCFLIRKGVVSFVEGDLKNACISDIDSDGKYELVDLYSDWVSGLTKYHLVAYEYLNPIYFNSLTEILQVKYSNCFVPKEDYQELFLKKVDDNHVNLTDNSNDYGTILIENTSLVVASMEEFPFDLWSDYYDQEILKRMDKVIPVEPPDINITIGGIGIDYILQKTDWDGAGTEYGLKDTFDAINQKDKFIPTFMLGSMIDNEEARPVIFDFGSSIPDSIFIYDSMLKDDGTQRYNEGLIQNKLFKIIDSSHIRFDLKQHMSYFLSSNSEDYKKDWYRLFRIVCSWGDNKCCYAFLINTGCSENLTEITDHEFLKCDGTYSAASSTWGLGLTIDGTNLPEHYIIEWHASNGIIRTWDEPSLKSTDITQLHRGYPMTFSGDDNKGAAIWTPISFVKSEDVTIEAVIYENTEDKAPIAYSKIIITQNEAGVYQKKE